MRITVTPCVGVWIETSDWFTRTVPVKSHPAWVCGLKQDTYVPVSVEDKSHPAWVCGLKQVHDH